MFHKLPSSESMEYMLGLLLVLMIAISISDIYHRRIPNSLLYLLFSNILALSLLYEFPLNYDSFIVTLVLGFILWCLKIIAAGDVKYIAILFVLVDSQYVLFTFFLVTFFGLVLAVFFITSNQFKSSMSKNHNLPYGVAISLGSVFGIIASL